MSIMPLNLTFVISSLSSGGAERVMSTMANYWAEKGWGITLITLDSVDSDFYALHTDIKRIALGLMDESSNPLIAVKNNITRIIKLRSAIMSSKPDAIISFMDRTNVLTLFATRGLGLKVIISERINPVYHNIGSLWSWLRSITYPWADVIVAQTEQVRQWLRKTVKKCDVVVIPNPIKCEIHEADNESSLVDIVGRNENKRIVVAIGRLSVQKGFDMLIKAFASIAHANPNWRLVILGEGKERDALLQLADKLGIAGSAHLPGIVKNTITFLQQADLFVMSSRYEGFPNALLEAMACGLPVISFDCPSGPRDIIRDGVDGVLVPPENVAALTEAMKRLMSDEAERKRLASNAPEVTERFGLEKVMGMWEDLIQGLIKK